MTILLGAFIHKRCEHCGGNLFREDNEVKCLMCGRPAENTVPDFILEEIKGWKRTPGPTKGLR